MLQLNHVTVTNNERTVLDDCTYQFREGQVYAIVGEPGDFVAFFKTVCNEKKTAQGEIVTWDGAERFNACDDTLLPFSLTATQYAEGLLKIYKDGEGHEPGVYLLEAGFNTSNRDKLIRELNSEDKAALRFMAMKLADKYVNVIGEPIPELALVADWAEKNKNDKVIIFGVSDEETAGVVKDKLGAEIVTFKDMTK